MKKLLFLFMSASSIYAMQEIIEKSSIPQLLKAACIYHGHQDNKPNGMKRPNKDRYYEGIVFSIDQSIDGKDNKLRIRDPHQKKEIARVLLPQDDQATISGNTIMIHDDYIVSRLESGLLRVLRLHPDETDSEKMLCHLYDLDFPRESEEHDFLAMVELLPGIVLPQRVFMCGGKKCEKKHYEEFVIGHDSDFYVLDKHGEMHWWDSEDIELICNFFNTVQIKTKKDAVVWERLLNRMETALKESGKFTPTKKERAYLYAMYNAVPAKAQREIRRSASLWKKIRKKKQT